MVPLHLNDLLYTLPILMTGPRVRRSNQICTDHVRKDGTGLGRAEARHGTTSHRHEKSMAWNEHEVVEQTPDVFFGKGKSKHVK